MTRTDVERDYVLWVDLPPTYDPDGDEPHPLYLCFDAMWTYGTVVDTVRLLAPSKELPKAIVVGVATTALGLALILRINEAFGSVEEDEIIAAKANQSLARPKRPTSEAAE